MLPALNHFVWNAVVLASVKKAQQETGGEQPLSRQCNVFLCDQAVLNGSQQVQISIAAVYVTSLFQGKGSGLPGIFRNPVVFMEILDCPAVRGKCPSKFHFPLRTSSIR